MKSIRSSVVSIVLLLLLVSLDGTAASTCKSDAECGDEGTCDGVSDASQVPSPTTCGDGKTLCYSPGGKCLKPWVNNNRSPHWICECSEGYSGTQCGNADASAVAAAAAETINALGECKCNSGFMGDMCEIPVKVCGYNSRCQYGGTCVKPWTEDNRSKYWICHCPEGRTGKECETLLSPTDDSELDSGELGAGGKIGITVGVMLFAGALFYAFTSLGARQAHTNSTKKHDDVDADMQDEPIGDDKPYTDEPPIGIDKLYVDEFSEKEVV